MRMGAWVAALTFGMTARADQPAAEHSVVVCMEIGRDGLVRTTAQPLVSTIFAEIGVRIHWARAARACVADEGIVVNLSYETPSNQYPNAWGYALPYERTHLVVFYDRVQKTTGIGGGFSPVRG